MHPILEAIPLLRKIVDTVADVYKTGKEWIRRVSARKAAEKVKTTDDKLTASEQRVDDQSVEDINKHYGFETEKPDDK